MPYAVHFTPQAANQLRALRATDMARIADQCQRFLSGNPTLTSKARVKRLSGDVFPPYRLRVGNYRVFYDVLEDRKQVMIYGVVDKAQADDWLAAHREERGHEADHDQGSTTAAS